MDEQNWIETKKEFIIDKFGNERLTKVSREIKPPKPQIKWLERNKEKIDILLKFTGLFGLAIPFTLFYFQQNAENGRKKAERQIDIYSAASTQLHTIISKDFTIPQIDSFKTKFFYETCPKIEILNDKEVITQLDSVRIILSYYLDYVKIEKTLISIYVDMNDLSSLSSDENKINTLLKTFNKDIVNGIELKNS